MTQDPTSRADDLDAIARSFLTYARMHGRDGAWVPGLTAFKAAIAEWDELEWVRETRAKPKERGAIMAVIRHLMQNDFSDVEMQRRNTPQSALVFFRVRT